MTRRDIIAALFGSIFTGRTVYRGQTVPKAPGALHLDTNMEPTEVRVKLSVPLVVEYAGLEIRLSPTEVMAALLGPDRGTLAAVPMALTAPGYPICPLCGMQAWMDRWSDGASYHDDHALAFCGPCGWVGLYPRFVGARLPSSVPDLALEKRLAEDRWAAEYRQRQEWLQGMEPRA